jgi:putative ABC transport system ATP-binding protein
MKVIQCKDLKKRYNLGKVQVEALRGISLDIEEGELLMLVGPSGSGKTTLISIIGGILNPTEGSCTVYGEDFSLMSDEKRTAFRANNIGFVFQAYNLVPMITAKENVSIPLLIAGVERKEAEKKALACLEKVGLLDKADSFSNELSGGQQQRVAIARAIVHDPKIIICDEPTSALDHETGMQVMGVFKDIAKNSHRTLIIVTHDARIFSFADRKAMIDDGKISNVS